VLYSSFFFFLGSFHTTPPFAYTCWIQYKPVSCWVHPQPGESNFSLLSSSTSSSSSSSSSS
jgi:hypothetical protein